MNDVVAAVVAAGAIRDSGVGLRRFGRGPTGLILIRVIMASRRWPCWWYAIIDGRNIKRCTVPEGSAG